MLKTLTICFLTRTASSSRSKTHRCQSWLPVLRALVILSRNNHRGIGARTYFFTSISAIVKQEHAIIETYYGIGPNLRHGRRWGHNCVILYCRYVFIQVLLRQLCLWEHRIEELIFMDELRQHHTSKWQACEYCYVSMGWQNCRQQERGCICSNVYSRIVCSIL